VEIGSFFAGRNGFARSGAFGHGAFPAHNILPRPGQKAGQAGGGFFQQNAVFGAKGMLPGTLRAQNSDLVAAHFHGNNDFLARPRKLQRRDVALASRSDRLRRSLALSGQIDPHPTVVAATTKQIDDLIER